jgi:hypothetical protein
MENKKIIWIDLPSGWKWGFPKWIPANEFEANFNLREWIIQNGYPRELILEFGDQFHYRIWEETIAERMYSEEDLREAFRQGQDNVEYSEMYGFDSKLTEQEWFEQFKK